MKVDLTQNSGFKIALIVIVMYAIIATITFMAWS